MEKSDFDKYVNGRYAEEIKWYDRRAESSQNWYSAFQWALIILSSLTPVLVAITFGLPSRPLFKWVPVLTAVLVAVLTAGLKTFKFQENWINYRTTAETLKKEIHLYRAGIGEYANAEDKEALFVERVESLISRENTLWLITAQGEERKKRS